MRKVFPIYGRKIENFFVVEHDDGTRNNIFNTDLWTLLDTAKAFRIEYELMVPMSISEFKKTYKYNPLGA